MLRNRVLPSVYVFETRSGTRRLGHSWKIGSPVSAMGFNRVQSPAYAVAASVAAKCTIRMITIRSCELCVFILGSAWDYTCVRPTCSRFDRRTRFAVAQPGQASGRSGAVLRRQGVQLQDALRVRRQYVLALVHEHVFEIPEFLWLKRRRRVPR